MIEVDEAPLRSILRTFTYKPGWSFSIEGRSLIVRATVIDADNLMKEIPLSFYKELPLMTGPDFLWAQWLLSQILTIERHEAQEFFKIDGVKVFDPHG